MTHSGKISVIICSIDAGKFSRVSENYRHLLANFTHEIIGIHDARSLAEGYNRGASRADGDIVIFSHDDIQILDPQFADKITARLESYDVLGFVGATRLINATWFGAGGLYSHGIVAHAPPKSRQINLSVFGADPWPVAPNVKALDGLCLIVRRKVARQVPFDAIAFDGFHLYDIDFSFSAYLAGFKLGVCCDIPIIHESPGQFATEHQRYTQRFMEKHQTKLDAPNARERKTGPHAMPEGRGANFPGHLDLLKSWRYETLRRCTIALRRQAEYTCQL